MGKFLFCEKNKAFRGRSAGGFQNLKKIKTATKIADWDQPL